jgi:2-methylcitrate dehydratase PrpD
MKDGAMLTARCNASRGTPENPMTRADIEEKCRRAAGGRLGDAQLRFVLDAISNLEDLKSVRTLMEALQRVDTR